LGDAVAQITALLAVVGDAELLAATVELYRMQARLDAARSTALAEVETRGAARATGAPSTAAWLRGATGFSPRAARADTSVAVALAGPRAVTGRALACGRISMGAARVIVRSLAQLPSSLPADVVADAEATLVELAGRLPEDQLAQAARHLRYVTDPDGIRALQAEEARLRRGRGLHLADDGGGWLRLSGQLDPVDAATVLAVLDPLAAPRPTAEDGPDPRTPAQRRADALVALAQIGLASGLTPAQGGSPVTLLVTVDHSALREDAARAGLLPTGTPVSPGQLRRLACDARILPAVLAGPSQPLDVGRAARTCPAHLRKALVLRDRGCAFPRCDRPWTWADAHHIRHWADGGTTDLDNLVLLCGHHHRVIHDQSMGWRIQANPGAPPTFRPPSWHPPMRQ
jgi:hypothetical protein